MRRLWLSGGLALLTACATPSPLVSTLDRTESRQGAESYVGVQVSVLAVEQVEPYLRAAEKGLARVLRQDAAWLKGAVYRPADDALRVRLDADRSFGAGSAQLDAAALAGYAALADSVMQQHSLVVHIVVYGALAQPADVRLSEPARRAATLQEYFLRRGLPESRLRIEARDGEAAVELVLKPVARGREAQAWTPPSG
jgi:flagellar motor protein MotB